MKTWSPLSEPYITQDGYMVAPVTSEEDLVTMGRRLRNGLSVGQISEKYATMCEAGRRQIVLVTDARGNPIANAELRVSRSDAERGEVTTMFVRGVGTDDLVEGNPAFDAVSSYISAINEGVVETIAHVRADGFAQMAPAVALAQEPQVALSPWERAVQVAQERGITPMQALINGMATVEPVAEVNALMVNPVVDENVWSALSDAYTAQNGLVVEPINSKAGLEVLGEDLENMLFIPTAVETYARRCAEGEIQIAAVRTAHGNIVGFSELAGLNGQTVVLACRGYADTAPSGDVAQAVMEYVGALTLNQVAGRNLFASGNGFSAEPFNFAGFADVRLPQVLGVVNRDGGYRGDYQAEGRMERYEEPEDNNEVAGELPRYEADRESLRRNGVPFGFTLMTSAPVGDDIEWASLCEAYEADNGLTVEILDNNTDFAITGGMLANALSSSGPRDDWANRCSRGEMQIFRVVNQDADPVRVISNGILRARDGRLVMETNLSAHNGPASVASNEALNEFITAVNNRNVVLNVDMNANGFDVNPQRRLGR